MWTIDAKAIGRRGHPQGSIQVIPIEPSGKRSLSVPHGKTVYDYDGWNVE
jgi:hypothetical protein